MQAALKKSNLELESELMVKLNNIEMMNEAAEMKDKIIKVTMGIRSILTTPSNAMVPQRYKFQINLGFWGNCPPTPPLGHHFVLSEK